MRRVSGGYTIVEVMIFLAVSTVLLAAGMKLISGRQEQTDFNQKARDTQSQIQSWIDAASNGFTGGDPSQYHCLLTSLSGANRPVIYTGAPGSNYSPDCIFLGKAIQFTDINNSGGDPSKLYLYSVFGTRESAGQLTANMVSASPEPAVGTNGGQPAGSVDLTDSFDLNPAEVTSVSSDSYGASPITDSHLIGFFNNFNTGDNQNNGQNDLNAYIYNFNANPTPGDQTGGSAIVHCLELDPTTCGKNLTDNPQNLKSLSFCLSDGTQTAQITITSSGGIGATVKLEYKSC